MRIIIFGTGKQYHANKRYFQNFIIEAFLDNNHDLLGTVLDGHIVDIPQNIHQYSYDYVILASVYYKEMREQLLELGVVPDKIIDAEHRGIWGNIRKVTQYNTDLAVRINRPKILLVAHDMGIAGAQLVLLDLAKVLIRYHYEVTVYACSEGALVSDFLNEGASVHVFENFVFSQEEVKKYFAEYDLILVNTVTLAGVIKNIENQCKKIVWWLHEEDDAYEKYAISSQDLDVADHVRIFGVCQRAIDSYIKFSGRCLEEITNKVDRLPYGVESRQTMLPVKNRQKKVFALIGTVCHRKGCDIFYQSIKENYEKWKDLAEFWMIGNISEEDRQLYEEVPLMRIWGTVAHEKLMEMYLDIDVVVCPSRHDPLPVVLTEGMMNKKVCIASDMTGTASYITPFVNGLICKAGDVQSLSDSIQWVLDHPDQLNEIGNRAYAVYKEAFSMEAFEKNVKEIVEDCLK